MFYSMRIKHLPYKIQQLLRQFLLNIWIFQRMAIFKAVRRLKAEAATPDTDPTVTDDGNKQEPLTRSWSDDMMDEESTKVTEQDEDIQVIKILALVMRKCGAGRPVRKCVCVCVRACVRVQTQKQNLVQLNFAVCAENRDMANSTRKTIDYDILDELECLSAWNIWNHLSEYAQMHTISVTPAG
ncbi:hypothetical protein ANN_03450 [Periplaneta americana]|uniref:Uncharacterized protein n=1 Tax=Periplaneta americana TaxID=6978 RepID=A0ABQ8U211_PERAM|nr:hypothetical protein ANN_03450 [Periplaneta americana]